MIAALPIPLSSRAKKYPWGWQDHCPAHDDRNASLSVFLSKAGVWCVKCWAGCSSADIKQAAGVPHPFKRMVPTPQPRKHLAQQEITRIWSAATSVTAGSLIETYFIKRGLHVWDKCQNLRFTSKAQFELDSGCATLLVPVYNINRITGFHQTFIKSDGTKSGRKFISGSKINGGAYRLTSNNDADLVVAEGLENAMAHMQLFDPCCSQSYWAALSANTMPNLNLPKNAGRLTIAVDRDIAGERAAAALAKRARLLGWDVMLDAPTKGGDWNDHLLAEKGQFGYGK